MKISRVKTYRTMRSFGLHLTKDVTGWGPHHTDDSIRIGGLPIISDEDIIQYAWKSHTMTVKEYVKRRLPTPGVEGVPFVVVVNGEKCYIGAFWTIISSASFLNPIICLDCNDNEQELKIEPWATISLPKNDLREDKKVRECLINLGKLK